MALRGPKPQQPDKKDAKPIPGKPTCPSHLKGVARTKWTKIVDYLDEMGVLSKTDGDVVEQLCLLYARQYEAERVLAKEGLTFTTPSGFRRPIPEVGIANDCAKQIKGLLETLGLTPAARARVNTTKEEEIDQKWIPPSH